MQPAVGLFISFCWVPWALIWLVASLNVKSASRHEDSISRLWNTAPLWLAALLLASQSLCPHILTERLLPWGLPLTLVGAVLIVTGLGFAIWARYHIGRNWS